MIGIESQLVMPILMLCAWFIQMVSKLAFVMLRNDPLDNIVVSSSALVSLWTVC